MTKGGAMRNIGGMLLAGCSLLPSLASCSSVTPHENFQMILGRSVGKSMDDPPRITNAYSDRFLSSTVLQNGNIENKYLWYGECRYYFEIDQKTHKIVGWRFEGSERDCRINP